MKKIVRLTESDLVRLVKRVIREGECIAPPEWLMSYTIDGKKGKSDCSNWNWRATDYLFVWVSIKDKMLTVTTDLELDETSKNAISTAMGVEPKKREGKLNWVKNFTSFEEGGDLNRMLDGLQGHIPWISTLRESYRRNKMFR